MHIKILSLIVISSLSLVQQGFARVTRENDIVTKVDMHPTLQNSYRDEDKESLSAESNKQSSGQITCYPSSSDSLTDSLEHEIEIEEADSYNLSPNTQLSVDFNKKFLEFNTGNLVGRAQIKYKPESFYARNINLLNNNNELDRTYFSRATVDVNLGLKYGAECYGQDVSEFFITIRNKATWGNAESIAQTTETETKILESVQPPHKHFVTKHILWIRELWLKFSINAAFGLPFEHDQYFKLGSFPFEVGRGISYGSAAAVNPGALGFFSDNSIDQFTYGFNFGGYIFDSLGYDLYGGIIENRADSFSATAAKIRGQEYGRRYQQERGSGHVNYVIITRLKWIPWNTDCNTVTLEPYALYHNVPEQKIEFVGDASAQLGTLGLAGEFKHSNFEWGFDTACNVGGQHVKGWDRNRIDQENRDGDFTVINTRVLDQATGAKIVYAPNSTTGRQIKKLIENSPQDQSQNGQVIGIVDGITLVNDLNRFTNPYNNTFDGWMAVADAAYWFYAHQIRAAVMVGAASGDENPNKDLDDINQSNQDKKYSGFIPLQELYTGDRVQSALVLGPSRLPRPLSSPTSTFVEDAIPSLNSGFTNLVFIGGSVLYTPKGYARKVNVKPNVLFYWQEHATKKFDIVTKMSSTAYASKRLGTEVNLFADVELLKDLKFFAVGGVFVPGTHYADIKGKPLNKDQQKALDVLDVTGVDTDNMLLLSDNTAFSINLGLEYRF